MVHKRITTLLRELQTELESAEQLDAETRAQIEDTAAELDEFLAEQDRRDEEGAFDALHKRLLSLEVEHPRVSAIIGETAELFSKLGV